MWRPGRIFLVLSFFLLIGGGCASVEAGDPSDAELAYRYYLQGRAAFRGERLSLALENFNAALSYKPKDPDTLSMVGQVHYLREAYGKAISSFEQALASPELSAPGDVQGWLVCCYYAQHRYREVVDLSRRILARDARNLIVWHRLIGALRQLGQDARGVRACQRALKLFPVATPELSRHYAYFLARQGDPKKAERIYQRILRRSRWLSGEEDTRRLALVQLGRYRKALAAWRGKGTSWVTGRDANRLRDRFVALEAAIEAAEQRDALDAQAGLRLGEAFEGCGWLAEAEVVLRRAHTVDKANARIKSALRRVSVARQFASRLRRQLYGIYGSYQREGEGSSLEQVLRQIGGQDRPAGLGTLDGDREISSLSFFYRYLNPGLNSRSRLVQYFRERGLLCLLFDFFGPVEGNIKNLLYWNPTQRRQLWGEWVEYELMICESSRIHHYREYLSHSSYGGLTFSPRSFWLDAETYARIAHHMLDAYRRVPQLGEPSRTEIQASGPLDVRHSSQLKDQLAYVIVRAATDSLPGADERELDLRRTNLITRWLLNSAEYHELGHIRLQRDYLPVTGNLFRGLGLLIQEGFSSRNISAWSERQAQLTALVHARRPMVALYRTISAIKKPAHHSRHAKGYRDILNGYVRWIYSNRREYPNIDTSRNIFSQLYLLTGDQVREIAKELY